MGKHLATAHVNLSDSQINTTSFTIIKYTKFITKCLKLKKLPASNILLLVSISTTNLYGRNTLTNRANSVRGLLQ